MSRHDLAPGVFALVFDNAVGDQAGVDGTALVIVNRHDVVVVDAQGTPATARRVIREIRRATRNPVSLVINTHWHGDHWLGNQAYRDAYPGVQLVAHPNTLRDMEAEELAAVETTWRKTLPDGVVSLRARLAKGVRSDGRPYGAADSARVARQIAAFEWAIPAMKEIRPVLPSLLVADSLIVRRDDRTIVVRYLGRGNTRGDLSVWLPGERILATGDLLVGPAPYSFGSYLGDWIETLGKLRALPASVVVPGHGPIRRDFDYLDQVVALLRSTLDQAKAAVARGLDLDATRKAVDLAPFRVRFAGEDESIGRAFDAFFVAPAVERAWLEARGEIDQAPFD